MKENKRRNFPLEKQPADLYDDDNIPPVDLPRDAYPMEVPANSVKEMPANIIPDEVPRKDGPGGEAGETC